MESAMQLFRHNNQAVVEAAHYDGSEIAATKIVAWSHGMITRDGLDLKVATPDGTLTAPPGFWIIRDNGHFRPMEPNYFASRYQPENPSRVVLASKIF